MDREKGKGQGSTADRKTRLASPTEWETKRADTRHSECQKTPGGHQGVGGGVESPQGINTPGVEEFPRGDETSGVSTKGEVVPGEYRQGQRGDGTLPATRATKVSGASGGDEGMTRRPGTAAPPSPQQGMAADEDSGGTCTGIPKAPAAPGPKTACNRVVSTAY